MKEYYDVQDVIDVGYNLEPLKCRLGKVVLSIKYVVDLDNQRMINEAKDCLLEDINSAVKFNELHTYIKVIEDDSVLEDDIPEFLKEVENW